MAAASSQSRQRTLVIVESPTKARTITKFLGKAYVVKASNGHIRDLPNNASEIPPKFKKEPWARMGVNIENDFEPLYVVPPNKKDQVKELRQAIRTADRIYFATDEDREGESISWHLLQALKPRIPVKRLVFHEITEEAIRHSLDSARDIDHNLVRAQETRRVVDRLFGYEVSPLLWRKMAPRLSAGRVQSVAVRLLVERERARMRFTGASFWGMKAVFAKNGETFEADLAHVGGKRVVIGKDFDPDSGKLKNVKNAALLDADAARALEQQVRGAEVRVSSVEEKPYATQPQAPFTTSTLQQEANRKLRFSARHTMGVAQQLYENGFITYMRTDSTMLSDEAKAAARSLVEREFGAEYLSEKVRYYRTQLKTAQEAHEAIRPAGAEFRSAQEVRRMLGLEAAKLYEMIWRRTAASQMRDARGTNSAVTIDAGEARFRATGKTIEFAGFLKAYAAGAESREAQPGGKERILPAMAEGDTLECLSTEAAERRTQPPARFTEGSLIRELERLGIGRPSTWSATVDLVLSRSYAFKKSGALIPTFTAVAVVGLLEDHFTHLMNYAFTAKLEDQLDAIANGKLTGLDYLKSFYYGNGHAGLQALVSAGAEGIDPRIVCSVPIGKTEQGAAVEVRIGRYGPFLSDGEIRATLPDMIAPDELTPAKAAALLEAARRGPEPIGADPQTGLPVYLKNGRFGAYVQLGKGSGEEKPKMTSLPSSKKPEEVDLDYALKLLAFPRALGRHPEDKKDVLAAIGRFGPYVKWGKEIRSIPADKGDLPEITLEQALDLLRQPRTWRRRVETLKEVGKHPITGKDLVVRSGSFGPYVTDGETNASLPRGLKPEELALEDAVGLLQARADRLAADAAAKTPRRRPAKRKPAAKKKAAPKKKPAAAKKAAAGRKPRATKTSGAA